MGINPIHIKPHKRKAVLEQSRGLKMARSAHAYVRGSTEKFYDWLDAIDPATLPEGPPVWICGDCHVGNLGPIASADGKVEVQIRDLDQTVIGNPAHDLVRLALSLAMAARGSDLPGVTTSLMLEKLMEGYQQGLTNASEQGKEDSKGATAPIRLVFKQALKRKWRHLAEERIEDVRPRIPLGKCFWEVSKAENREIRRLFQSKDLTELITCLHDRNPKDQTEVADTAYWVKGCSSLGRLRYAVLVQIRDRHEKNRRYCLIDIKEAGPTAAPRAFNARMPKDHALRVTEGARALSPYLGERMLAAHFLRRPVVVRELMPQDLKLELNRIDCQEAVGAAHFLAAVVGKAHGRQLTADARRSWKAELDRNRSKTLDAPSWLWKSVVDLVAIHEAAYLDHCRAYALRNIAS
jgi:uncharacterized protein (DUF2252 family)